MWVAFFSFVNGYICFMNKITFIFIFLASTVNAQVIDTIKPSKYLEDQIYVGLSYILLNNVPNEISSNGFSNSFELGFIKDFPLNQKGNVALGLGLGYGRNTYYQNIKITRPNNSTLFETITEDFKNNKFSTHVIDIPLEIRLRTSTIDKYKFWRFYAGGKLSYVFASNAKFRETGNTIKINGISEINKLQYGLTLAAGYGTWNFKLYYGISNIFSDARLNETIPLNIKDIRIGLVFYIL